jgi:hypothetical protein
MTFISNYTTPGNCVSSATKIIQGTDYAFLALGNSGIEIANISNPSNPHYVVSYNLSGYQEQIAVDYINNVPYAFVASGNNGLTILDLTNINAAVLDTVVNFSGDYIQTLYLDSYNQYLYAGGKSNKMYIIDLYYLPNHISVVNNYLSFSEINEIYVQDKIAFIAQDDGLDIVNVSNPLSPYRLSHGTSEDYAYGVKVDGNLAYIANNQDGVLLLDVSNPSSPREISYIDTYDIALDCAYFGHLLYIAEDDGGVEVYDVSSPSNPRYLAQYRTNGYSESVTLFNNLLLVSNYYDLMILRYP